jgi:hypothetical protein
MRRSTDRMFSDQTEPSGATDERDPELPSFAHATLELIRALPELVKRRCNCAQLTFANK